MSRNENSNEQYIIRDYSLPPYHLTRELSPMAKLFYDKMKLRNDKKKNQKEKEYQKKEIEKKKEEEKKENEKSKTTSINEIEEVCAICVETDQLGNLFKTKCGHVFHKNCLNSWCNHNNSCPICRIKNPFNYKELTPYEITLTTIDYANMEIRNQYIPTAQNLINYNLTHNIQYTIANSTDIYDVSIVNDDPEFMPSLEIVTWRQTEEEH